MKIYDKIILEFEEITESFKQRKSTISKSWVESSEDQLIFKNDSAFELGGSNLPAYTDTFYTTNDDIVNKDEVILIGNDLKEIKEDTPYSRIAIINIDEEKIGTGTNLYKGLMKIDYMRYHVYPEGFMTRISSMNERESARASKNAIRGGINFFEVGNLYIEKYHQLDFVKSVKLYFVTEKSFPYEKVKDLIEREKGITKALDHLSSKIKMDCNACNLQVVCKEVEELTKKEFEEKK